MPSTIRWRDWSPGTFREAAARRQPLLLSIVTAWSEECAAMDASVYSRADVAALIEARVVPVRIDADARPDVNDRYNMGGWPSTVLLTPDGDMLSGDTYLGPDQLLAMLTHAADAWRDRAGEIRAIARRDQTRADVLHDFDPAEAVEWFRAELRGQFDFEEGGFGSGAKYPHSSALLVALALAEDDNDPELREIADVSIDRIGALWDPAHGGFYRYAAASDWTHHATEKTVEDHAALLNLYLDAAIRLDSDEYRTRAAELARWVKTTFANVPDGGFFNSQAAVSRVIDRSIYVDRNADMIGALLRAAVVFDDPWLRDFSLSSLESVILPGYVPGRGLAHVVRRAGPEDPPLRGLLSDQVRTSAALIWAHVTTGQLPYSMLALELMQYAIRTMWNDAHGWFFDDDRGAAESSGVPDPALEPFELNCQAACVLTRLATITGDRAYQDRAVSIVTRAHGEFRQHGLFAAPYILAVREIQYERRPPLLQLSHVDWDLSHD